MLRIRSLREVEAQIMWH